MKKGALGPHKGSIWAPLGPKWGPGAKNQPLSKLTPVGPWALRAGHRLIFNGNKRNSKKPQNRPDELGQRPAELGQPFGHATGAAQQFRIFSRPGRHGRHPGRHQEIQLGLSRHAVNAGYLGHLMQSSILEGAMGSWCLG